MKANEYTATCKLFETRPIQEEVEIIYRAAYETEKSSIIRITRLNSTVSSTEEFRCQISFCDCIGLITLFKENFVYPVHCRDVASDLGYKIIENA